MTLKGSREELLRSRTLLLIVIVLISLHPARAHEPLGSNVLDT